MTNETRGMTAPIIFDAVEGEIVSNVELELRELKEGEMLQSVPISEVNPNAVEAPIPTPNYAKENYIPSVSVEDDETVDGDDDGGCDQEEEQSMNIIEQHQLLAQQKEACANKAEDDKLYDSITTMTDEELQAAVAEETTDIKEGDGQAPQPYNPPDDARVVNNMMIDNLTEQELIELYNVAVKAKADPNFNVVAALPKTIYDNIQSNCKALGITSGKVINNFARMLITELVQEMALDKECKAFQDEINKAMAFPEIVDMYAEHTRELMEVNLVNQAETLEGEAKEELLATSKAYTDAYTLVRQFELLKNDAFVRGLEKKVNKRFDRFCDSFDFTMSRSILKTIHVKDLLRELPHVLQLNETQCKVFIILLSEVSKNIKADDKPGVWFMYSSVRNIMSLARTGTNKTAFSTECIGYLKDLFATLEKRHTELFSV